VTSLQIIDAAADPRWRDYASRHSKATAFHSPEWMTVLGETYGFAPCSLALMEADRIVALLPLMGVHSRLTGRRGVSLPFSDNVEPLCDDERSHEALLQGLPAIVDEHRWRYLELRYSTRHASNAPVAEYRWHTLALDPDPDRLFRTFKKTQIQQSIQRARKAGVVVELRHDEQAMGDFIRLNALTRRKHGVPPQPDRFFWNLHRHMIAGGDSFIARAEHGGRAIAAAVYLAWGGKTLTYKYSASDGDALATKPNHLAMWEAVRFGCSNGYTTMDFGRTEADNEGLLYYKRGWGTQERELTYVRVGEPRRSGRISGVRNSGRLKDMIRKMPIPLLKLIGKIVFPHLA